MPSPYRGVRDDVNYALPVGVRGVDHVVGLEAVPFPGKTPGRLVNNGFETIFPTAAVITQVIVSRFKLGQAIAVFPLPAVKDCQRQTVLVRGSHKVSQESGCWSGAVIGFAMLNMGGQGASVLTVGSGSAGPVNGWTRFVGRYPDRQMLQLHRFDEKDFQWR